MRIVVMGGTGLIGSKVTARLEAAGVETVIGARSTGVDSYTGEGLAGALAGAEVLIDLSNSSYTDYGEASNFFYGSTLNLLATAAPAGIGHYVALSVVGTDRSSTSSGSYFAAKRDQERLIQTSGQPYSLVRSTQFFEYLLSIADAASRSGAVRLSPVAIEPVAADDVAAAVVEIALGRPTRTATELAGPERFRLDEIARLQLRLRDDPREVVTDPLASYFGVHPTGDDLLPVGAVIRTPTRLHEWFRDRRHPGGGSAELVTPSADADAELVVRDDIERSSYLAVVDGRTIGEIPYARDGEGRTVLLSTVIDPEFRGLGIATGFIAHVMDERIANGERLIVECPTIRAFVAGRREYDDIVVVR